MKRNLLFAFLAITGLLFGMASCQKAPELTLTSSSNIEFSADGSSGSITFTANRDWTARANDSWVSVSPSSGAASDGAVTVTVRCNANTTYEDRSTTVTINMGDLSQAVTVKQPANKGIVLPKQVFELQSDTRSIDVEVQANVQYSVSSSVDWIKQTGTKALTSKTLTFSIQENKTYDPREGKIIIKPNEGNVQEQVITVRQAQKDALIVEKTSYDMPYGGGEIEIKVEANVAYSVTPNVDWLHHTQTKALTNSTVCIKVDENSTYSNREGKIEIAQQNGSLKHTITVKQAGRIAVTSILLNKTNLTLFLGESETLVATAIPDNATDKTITWTSSNSEVATVDKEGRVSALMEGTATISAKAGEAVADCKVRVNKQLPVPEVVDLGLSVCWASFNLGATKPEEYGYYFAWGEVEPKQEYNWQSYKWGDGSLYSMKKYNQNERYGSIDTKTVLDLEDDAAFVNIGPKWRMPTKEDCQELRKYCISEPNTVNGIAGYTITSKINGNSIFLPSAGQNGSNGVNGQNEYGEYWTSTLNVGYKAWGYSGSVEQTNNRCSGLPIRPVLRGFSMAPTFSEMQGEGGQITFSVMAEDNIGVIPQANWIHLIEVSSGYSHEVRLSIDKNETSNLREGVVQVSTNNGEINRYFTVFQAKSYSYVAEGVDLGLSVKWSSTNIGASSPSDYGAYFAWGEIEPKVKFNYGDENYKWSTGFPNYSFTKYSNINVGIGDNKTKLDQEDDAAHMLLGEKWRMPTPEEIDELFDGCSLTEETLDGILGIRLTSKANGNSIFLPFAGSFYSTQTSGLGEYGHFWSSSIDSNFPPLAYEISIASNLEPYYRKAVFPRIMAVSIRPVSD